MQKPHVIYMVADQLRYDMLGRGLTPNIDSIAANGVQFSHAYCGSPLCVPARGALFTGTYPNTNGSLINPWFPLDNPYGSVKEGIDNLYLMMERGGWECIHSGKQHLYTQGGNLETRPETKTRWMTTEGTYREFLKNKGARMPGGGDFRSPVPEMTQGKYTRLCTYSNANTGCYEEGVENYFDGYFTHGALEGLRARDRDKPLFLSAMFLAPHPPLDVPDPFYSLVKAEEVTLPENVGQWYKYQSPLQMYNLTGIVGARYTLPQWRESWRVYMGLVSLLDNCVGQILEELRAQGIYEESLIVFTTDHGEMLGSHKLFQKMCMYEESARAPVYLRFPKNRFAGTVLQSPASHVDIQPTLCDYLGENLTSEMDGISLMPAIKTGAPIDHPVFIQFDGNGARGNFQRCVIQGEHKLIVDLFKDEVYFELYNIYADPQETDNLLFGEVLPPVANKLLDTLLAHMERTGDMITFPTTDLSVFVQTYRGLPARGGS